jgi:hypothetical protein
MEQLEILKQEWQIICGAPHITIAGAIAICVATWAIVKWVYSARIATLKERTETYKVQKEFASIEFKEQVTALQNQVVELNQQIKANAQQEALLPISNSTVAAVNQLDVVTNKLGDAKDIPSYSDYKKDLMSGEKCLHWRRDSNGDFRTDHSRPRLSFRIQKVSSPNEKTSFVLLDERRGQRFPGFPSLNDAFMAAEHYRQYGEMHAEIAASGSKSRSR